MGYKTVNVRGKKEKEILEELDGKFDAVIGLFWIIWLPRWRVVSIENNGRKIDFVKIASLNPLTTGKGNFWPTCFLTPRLSAWPLHKIQNLSNVKLKSLALFFDSKFDHKLFSSLKITLA